MPHTLSHVHIHPLNTARHNSDGEEPYEKPKVVPNYPDNYEVIY